MKTAVETLNPTRVKLTVEVPFQELKPNIDAAYKAIGSQIAVPGFRPGKIPTRLIEQRVGRGAVLQEAINEALPELYTKAIDENELKPLGQPEVDITEVPDTDNEQLVFTAEVDVRPDITLPDFSAMEVSVDALTEEKIDETTEEQLTLLRQRFGTLKPVDRACAEGDVVTIGLRGTIDGEEIDNVESLTYDVGAKTLIDGLDEQLVGMKADEKKTFKAPLAGGDRAGEEADIEVTLTAVKERELPELNDDFAQLASEHDTLAELREHTRAQAKQSRIFEQGVQARDLLLEKLLEEVEIPVPQGVVDDEVARHFSEGHEDATDEHRAEVEANATKGLKTQLLLDHVAEKEEVEVTQEELIEFLVMSAQQYGMDPNQFAQALGQNNQMPAMVGEVARRKALATILESIVVKDSNGDIIDLNASAEQIDGSAEDETADA